jgi:hypothetical protein
MSRNPKTYRDPDAFDPSRFMGDNPELDPRAYIFGFGRRICPGTLQFLLDHHLIGSLTYFFHIQRLGRIFADQNLFLTLAVFLATLSISKEVDSQGNEVTPPLKFVGGLSR